jgi:hypothetical protein
MMRRSKTKVEGSRKTVDVLSPQPKVYKSKYKKKEERPNCAGR